jgi:hypothetical protein
MTSPPITPALTLARIRAVSIWIDRSPANQARDPEALLFGRVAKVAEEAGEAVKALIEAGGHNPRKPATATLQHVEYELLDVAMAALCALAHLYNRDPHPPDLLDLLARHVHHVARRAGVAD